MSKVITRTLYRSLLRAAKPFASSCNGPVLCSLLYRIGLDDDQQDVIRYLEEMKNKQTQMDIEEKVIQSATLSSARENENKSDTTISLKDVRLSKEEARDLSRTYNELQKMHLDIEKKKIPLDYNDMHDFMVDLNDDRPESSHFTLYKQLLRKLFFDDADGVLRQMQFPTQTSSMKADDKTKKEEKKIEEVECIMGQKLVDIIQREFRSPSKNVNNGAVSNNYDDTLSKLHTDSTRIETGFLALRELQKKLTWAESMGMHDLFHYHNNRRLQEDLKQKDEEKIKNQARIVRDIKRLPTYPPPSYLQTGALLLAHPMLGGVFNRSIICILQHTEGTKQYPTHDDEIHDDDEDDDIDAVSSQNGGTYGLVINNPLTVGVPGNNPERRRNRTLREVIRHNSLPEGVRVAFGSCPVRNGGPVNLSIQMLRTASPEQEDKLQIGGTVIPTVLNEDSDQECVSSAMYSDKAIYFGGDIIKAAQAVIDGDMERGKFFHGFRISTICKKYYLHFTFSSLER